MKHCDTTNRILDVPAPLFTTLKLILTLRLKHLAIWQHKMTYLSTRNKPCCTFQDPVQKHLLPMQGKEASNPSSASWKDPWLIRCWLLVPVLQTNSDLASSRLVLFFYFWVKHVSYMVSISIHINIYISNWQCSSLFRQRLRETLIFVITKLHANNGLQQS